MSERRLIQLHSDPQVAAEQRIFIDIARRHIATQSEEVRNAYRRKIGEVYTGIVDKFGSDPSELAGQFREQSERILDIALGRDEPKKEAQRSTGGGKKKRARNLLDLRNVLAKPRIEKALLVNNALSRDYYARRKAQQELFLRGQYGDDYAFRNPSSPSIAAICLRWDGYQRLGVAEAKEEKGLRAVLPAVMGTAIHRALAQILQRQYGSQILPSEEGLIIEEPEMSGRMDYIYRNPLTKKNQLWEVKTVSSFIFKQIKRDGFIPDYLKRMPGVYPLNKVENRRQVLIYLAGLDGTDRECEMANVLYISRDSGEVKEAVLFWDDATRFEAGEYMKQIKEAQEYTDTNLDPPLPTIAAESKSFYCGRVCPFRDKCEYAAEFVGKAMRRRDIPIGVRMQAKRQDLAFAEKILETGAFQASLNL